MAKWHANAVHTAWRTEIDKNDVIGYLTRLKPIASDAPLVNQFAVPALPAMRPSTLGGRGLQTLNAVWYGRVRYRLASWNGAVGYQIWN